MLRLNILKYVDLAFKKNSIKKLKKGEGYEEICR